MHFFARFQFIRAQGVRFIVIKEVRNYGKIVFIKSTVEKGW